MARVGAGAAMARSINDMGQNILAWQMRKDALKKAEREEALRKEMMYQDNARWTAQDSYRREQDNIRQGQYDDRLRREDERFSYQQEQDAYKQKQDELRANIDRLYRQEQDAADNAYKYDALSQKYAADAAGAGGKDIMPQPFTIDANGRKYTGLRNPQTGAYDLDKPEQRPTVRITERDPLGTLSVSRTIGLDEYEKQQAAKNPQPVIPPRDLNYIESRLKADPKDEGALWRQKRMQATTQPTGTGAFAPPQNAASPAPAAGMGNMDKAAILEEAAKAIQAGKDPAAVKQRLKELGISY